MGCMCVVDEQQTQIELKITKIPVNVKSNSKYNSSRHLSPMNSRNKNLKNSPLKVTFSPEKYLETNFSEMTRENTSRITFNNTEKFNKLLFEEINLLRKSPRDYVDKMKKYFDFLNPNTDSMSSKYSSYIELPGSTLNKILFIKGRNSFLECINLLDGMYSLPLLIYKEDLEIQIPEDSSTWTRRDIITNLINNKTKKLAICYTSYGFHFDINSINPELSVILQLIDDNNFKGQRRNNLLSNTFRYIGISNSDQNCKMSFCTYLNFAY